MVKENFAQPSKSIKILWTWLHNIGTLWDIILHNGVQVRAGLKLKPSDREIWFDYYENLGSTKLKPATEFFIFQDCMHLTVWYMRLINHLHLATMLIKCFPQSSHHEKWLEITLTSCSLYVLSFWSWWCATFHPYTKTTY